LPKEKVRILLKQVPEVLMPIGWMGYCMDMMDESTRALVYLYFVSSLDE
jgi:hypothetical protein